MTGNERTIYEKLYGAAATTRDAGVPHLVLRNYSSLCSRGKFGATKAHVSELQLLHTMRCLHLRRVIHSGTQNQVDLTVRCRADHHAFQHILQHLLHLSEV